LLSAFSDENRAFPPLLRRRREQIRKCFPISLKAFQININENLMVFGNKVKELQIWDGTFLFMHIMRHMRPID
jgi:hypothetical protein